MFVGHGLYAFAVVAAGARLLGRSPRRALALGASAGAFATLPDVDIVYALVGVLGSSGGVMGAAHGFWAASTAVHRAVTHSLVVGAVAAVAFRAWRRAGGWAGRSTAHHAATAGLLAGLVGVAGVVSGPLGAFVMAVFAVCGLGITEAATRYAGLGPRAVVVTALVGLLSHPFGDLFTGEPPAMLYPFDATLFAHRLAFSADPTLDLLGAFWMEIVAMWLAAGVYCWLTDRRLREYVRARAALGLAYAAAAFVVPAPTIDSSYRFVFTVLAVGVVGPAPLVARLRSAAAESSVEQVLTAGLTGLAAVTLASVAYAMVYVAR